MIPAPAEAVKNTSIAVGESDMKIQEFRDLLKEADRERLEKAFAECYKQFPKAKKEEIDLLVQDILSGGDVKKSRGTGTVKFENLEGQIALFVENAYAQNYFAPNRFVPKNQRSKWRFLVMNFIKELDKIPPENPYFERAVQCLWDLYDVLCEGCNIYLFSTDDPFASVRWGQPELYHLLVKKTFQLGYSRENVREAISRSSGGGLSRTSLYIMNQMALLSELKTSDVKYMAMEEAKKLIEGEEKPSARESYYSSDPYFQTEKRNNLCGLVLLISISLAETEKGIKYYFSKCRERDKEIVLFCALDCAEWMDDERAWIDIYRFGLTKRIKPRESLRERYEELMGGK